MKQVPRSFTFWGVRVSFSKKQNAKTQFSGKPSTFSAKNAPRPRFNRPATFEGPRFQGSQRSQRFQGSQAMVTSAPFRRQYPSNGRNPFFNNRQQQMVTNAPLKQTQRPWISPINRRSNTDPWRSNVKQSQHPLDQNAIQRPNRMVTAPPTYRPILQQFVQPYQYKKEAITTIAPPVTAMQGFSTPGYAFGNQNNQGQNQAQQHPMADALIQINPPPPPSQQIRQAQGQQNRNSGRKSGGVQNKLAKIGNNNKIMNNPPPYMLANNVPLFKQPAKPKQQNVEWRSNPNPRRQGGKQQVNRQGKNYNWMNKRKPGGRRPGKPRQRPMPAMTTPQTFSQFDPQAQFPGQQQSGFPFQAPPYNRAQQPTPPTMPPNMGTNPPMYPPTQPSPYAPTFPPPTDPFYMPTTHNPTTRATPPPTPAPTRAAPVRKTTISGIGNTCQHTAECSAGCCFDQTGTMLDTDTYGPNALKNGLASGTCQMKQPGLGETCDDLCACKSGFECYRRYKPNYKQGKVMADNPMYEPPAPPTKPRRTCMRKAVSLAERWAFWKCYFDTACSGPLLK